MGEGQDRVAERARRPVHARRIVAAVLVAVIAVAGFAVGAGAQPPAEPRIVQPPADNVFPIPVPYEVTFSDSWHACRDGCNRPHKGNDLMADEGVPLVAVEPGVIVRANATDRGLGGVTLWLLGDSGVAYYYAHNSQNLAAEGQRVARGEVIATVGRTGNARDTAPHLHFQINLCGNTSSSEPCTVDPHAYLQSWSQAQVGGGTDGVGWYEPATGAFGRRNESGSPLSAFPFGTPGADQVPVAGDWDGDGRDSVGLYSRTDAVFSLLDDEGVALAPLAFGQAGRTDVWPIAGDFDGDGRDTVGLYRQAEAAFAVLVDIGVESAPVSLGAPGRTDALPVVGDWDGDGRDSVGVYQQGDGAVARLDDEGAAMDALVLPAGPEVFPVAGDWDGDGREDLRPCGATPRRSTCRCRTCSIRRPSARCRSRAGLRSSRSPATGTAPTSSRRTSCATSSARWPTTPRWSRACPPSTRPCCGPASARRPGRPPSWRRCAARAPSATTRSRPATSAPSAAAGSSS